MGHSSVTQHGELVPHGRALLSYLSLGMQENMEGTEIKSAVESSSYLQGSLEHSLGAPLVL